MTSLTFSMEQVKSAPLEVRRWIEREITATLAALNDSQRGAAQIHAPTIAACSPEEAAEVFEAIRGDFLLSQVFFELARDTPDSHDAAPLHPLRIADILRHTRLSDGDRLVDCFTALNQAFQAVHNDPDATLFGFDQYEHVFVHPTTHDSIRRLWEQLLAVHAAARGRPAAAAERPAVDGFNPPRLGPSEEILQHLPVASGFNL